ncbi:hypothetical protein A5714_16060 [Mycobacterium sp. E2462]|uniref:hypothetical protein n=1 Tax=Mycobacterium sp. E2462 TaxID=1834133 RepID=UPI000801A154|nr:hypothetical protein [Mycobacterium sp. E2462]OBI11571.1 hypothetical protein A5714_16060 [Mycobacterium sp. E2462]
MAEAKKPPRDSTPSKAETMALIAEAEAEAAEAEALAAAARARARAARLRREAQAADDAAAQGAKDTAADGATADDTGQATGVADTAAEQPAQAVADTPDAAAHTADAADADDEVSEPAETDTADGADDEAAAEPAPARRRLRAPSLAVLWKAAAVVLILAFVGASAYMVWQHAEDGKRNERVAKFLAGARQGVVNMTSLDFNRAKEDVQRVLDSSTGQFRDDFAQRAKDFTTVVEQSKVVTQGTVNAAAVQSINGNSALVLVAATSRITNAAGANNEPRNWRLKVTVTDDGGQYKMSNVEFVP